MLIPDISQNWEKKEKKTKAHILILRKRDLMENISSRTSCDADLQKRVQQDQIRSRRVKVHMVRRAPQY